MLAALIIGDISSLSSALFFRFDFPLLPLIASAIRAMICRYLNVLAFSSIRGFPLTLR
jgi:hypothetical protein